MSSYLKKERVKANEAIYSIVHIIINNISYIQEGAFYRASE